MLYAFELVKKNISIWLKTNEFSNKSIYKMSANAYHEFSLDASTLAYDIFNIIKLPMNEDDIAKSLDFLLSCQKEEDGFFYEHDIIKKLSTHPEKRVIEMSSNYLTFQTIGALKVFNKLPKYKISFYDKFIKNKGIKNYLQNNCPWDRSPWGAGGMIDNLGTILDCNIRMGYKEYVVVLDQLFEWLEENQSNEHGMWGDIKPQGINGLINGAYHTMRGTYFLQNRPFKYPELIIDNILDNLKTNKIFDNYAEGCHDLDSFYLLEKCHCLVPEYKEKEIKIVSQDRYNEIIKLVYCTDGAFSFEADKSLDNHAWIDVSAGKKESDMLGTVFYLQTIISIYKILGKNIKLNESKTHG